MDIMYEISEAFLMKINRKKQAALTTHPICFHLQHFLTDHDQYKTLTHYKCLLSCEGKNA